MATRKTTQKTAAKKTAKKPVKKSPSKAEQKKVAEADSAARDSAFFRDMKPAGSRIKGELDKATTADKRADDLRLTAAVEMAAAENKFIAHKPKGVTFQGWCREQGIVLDAPGRSWENLRKLLPVGHSSDPAKALADLRAGGTARQAASRARKESNGGAGEPKATEHKATEHKVTPHETADKAINSMNVVERKKFVEEAARTSGVLADLKAKVEQSFKDSMEEQVSAKVKSVTAAFDKLSAKHKMDVLRHAADACGVGLDFGDFDTGKDGLEIPAAAKRT